MSGMSSEQLNDLLKKIKNEINESFDLNVFVETGTFIATTAKEMSKKFKNVITMEIDETLYNKAVDLNKDIKNIKFLLGDSKKVLPSVVEYVNQNYNDGVVFFLDAHNSDLLAIAEHDATGYGELLEKFPDNLEGHKGMSHPKCNRVGIRTGKSADGDVPLYEELEIICNNYSGRCLIIIDDMHLCGKHHWHGNWRNVTREGVKKIIPRDRYMWAFRNKKLNNLTVMLDRMEN